MQELFSPTADHSLLRESVRAFTMARVEPQANVSNREELFNRSLFNECGSLGLLGVTVDEQFGGAGLDPTAAVIIHEELSASDPGLALAYLAHSMLCLNNINTNGNLEQKAAVLPKLCRGEWIGAMGMSEPGAGTDVLGMSTSATRVDGGYLINGRKMWITNGAIDQSGTPCDVLLLYAKTGVDDRGRAQISTFLLQRDRHDFTVGQIIKGKLGMRSSMTAELCFNDCFVEESSLVGIAGDSITHMMKNLELERLTLAAMALGIARRCLQSMLDYAEQRKAFGKRIIEFGQIQSHLAQSFAEYSSARAYVYAVARQLSLGASGSSTQVSTRLDSDRGEANLSADGKKSSGSSYPSIRGKRLYRGIRGRANVADAKLLEIGGGTLESHEKNIAKDLSAAARTGFRF